ncbi:hypothetical protein K435DRAFT_851051 [Dendrothele bispora CBS 962.96]|uniref:Uncharacterized protein n=1 Tax=Dendrothele bispora (strain CBS 962.96) TaxID=1314807 RepID=A0A4S8MN67_DENBC|nr:hypothetical protein K435DRAFT_851051 [Dendrothele bispora CBS 962.96]
MPQFTLSCIVRNMWSYGDTVEQPQYAVPGGQSAVYKTYTLEVVPDPDHQPLFDECIQILQGTVATKSQAGPCVVNKCGDKFMLVTFTPSLTGINCAEDIVIPPAPKADFDPPTRYDELGMDDDIPTARFYDHWNNERKGLTIGAAIEVSFHVVYEQGFQKEVFPMLVAHNIDIVKAGVPWYTLHDTPGDHSAMFTIPLDLMFPPCVNPPVRHWMRLSPVPYPIDTFDPTAPVSVSLVALSAVFICTPLSARSTLKAPTPVSLIKTPVYPSQSSSITTHINPSQ